MKYHDRIVLIPLFFNAFKFIIIGHDDNGCFA